MGALKELKVVVGSGENFTANSLMIRYAALHAGVEFEHLPYFETGLRIGNELYKYDHWKIETGDDGTETVTLFMKKVEKELYRWSVDCAWPAVGYSETVSVLAENLKDAQQMAQEKFSDSSGALSEETVMSNIAREKADLGLELYRAVKDYNSGYAEVARFLRLGADVNYRFMPDEYNFTPLHMAANNADLLKMELLVEAGCELSPIDANGSTPLDLAIARHNRPEIVDYLVERGARRGLDVVLENARERSKALVDKATEHNMEMF